MCLVRVNQNALASKAPFMFSVARTSCHAVSERSPRGFHHFFEGIYKPLGEGSIGWAELSCSKMPIKPSLGTP